MHALAALALLAASWPTGATGIVVGEPNAVEVCSVASGECRRLSAAALDPTLAPRVGGQVAFVDPETGELTQPTREQLAELEGPLALFEEARAGAVVDTVRYADGTVVAAPRGGFAVELRAVVVPADDRGAAAGERP